MYGCRIEQRRFQSDAALHVDVSDEIYKGTGSNAQRLQFCRLEHYYHHAPGDLYKPVLGVEYKQSTTNSLFIY